jgi:rhodanese-related sulfurtransferase
MTSYAGELSSKEAWENLKNNDQAVLVDVRTRAEWNFVGVADLSTLGKEPVFIPWQVYPNMTVNSDFVAELEKTGVNRDTPLYFMCRSGARSRAAAIAATEAGFEHCYNVSDGFEGDPDEQRHRSRINGWKANDLPWVQN